LSSTERGVRVSFQCCASPDRLSSKSRSVLLKQVFNQINIDGGELVQRIELLETQGDSTVLRMQDTTSEQPLSAAEQHDFAE
jgi:hypothetical protein